MGKKTEVVVIGGGPGGYTAAFRAADLGKKVTLIEKEQTLGGVCLNVGCIPSKALLHMARVIDEAASSQMHGVHFGPPQIDLEALRAWKNSIITKLTSGLKGLAQQRQIDVIYGQADLKDAHTVVVNEEELSFQHAILAVGSRPVSLPFLPQDPRIIDSTGALELQDIPAELLVIGAGIIGMEMATVYAALGSQVTVVELTDDILGGVDKDLAKPLLKRMSTKLKMRLKTQVVAAEAKSNGIWVTFDGQSAPSEAQRFDKVLVAVGRTPNTDCLALEQIGIQVERGFVRVDKQLRTNIEHIFAIGDMVGNPMLAHKAIPEGRVAAEVIAGQKHFFEPLCIPSVAYTDPEVAWVGVTEKSAREQNIPYEVGIFPWAASGRALAMARAEGMTKVLFDPQGRVIGGGITGVNAGDLIAELALAIEMGCEAEDLALTIHPHPTIAETVAMAAEVFEGTITDLYLPKKSS